jgi:hypothetical protein
MTSAVSEALAIIRNERDDALAREACLADHLTFILPMAKGYAAANRVGRNAEMIADAEAALTLKGRR